MPSTVYLKKFKMEKHVLTVKQYWLSLLRIDMEYFYEKTGKKFLTLKTT